MKIIIDTNIIFSGLLNSNSLIGELLINSTNSFEFYSCNHMRYEIQKHWEKLKRISKLSDQALADAQYHLFKRINFVNEEIISPDIWRAALELTNDIDVDDTDFVALTIFLEGHLWTGDNVLYNGLRNKKFMSVVNTQDLSKYNS